MVLVSMSRVMQDVPLERRRWIRLKNESSQVLKGNV